MSLVDAIAPCNEINCIEYLSLLFIKIIHFISDNCFIDFRNLITYL